MVQRPAQIKFVFRSKYGRYRFACPKSDPYTPQWIRNHGRSTVVFERTDDGRGGVLELLDADDAKYLRRVKKANPLLSFQEDLSAFPLICSVPGCTWSRPDSSDKSRLEHYDHMLNDHSEFYESPVPIDELTPSPTPPPPDVPAKHLSVQVAAPGKPVELPESAIREIELARRQKELESFGLQEVELPTDTEEEADDSETDSESEEELTPAEKRKATIAAKKEAAAQAQLEKEAKE